MSTSSTKLAELIVDLQTDYGDDFSDEKLDEKVAERAIIRALAFVSHDVNTEYRIYEITDGKEIRQELTIFHRELLLLRSLAYLIRVIQSRSAVTISFRSGDKQVKRTATNWKEMERDLLNEYKNLLKKNNPSSDSNILSFNLNPIRYSRGSSLE